MQSTHASLMAKRTTETESNVISKLRKTTKLVKLVSPLPHTRNLRLSSVYGYNEQYFPSCAGTLHIQNRRKNLTE